jgi:hypothetical protein
MHVAADKLGLGSTGSGNVRGVVDGNAVLVGQGSPVGEVSSVGSHDAAVGGYGLETLFQPLGRCEVMPRPHGDVGDLVEGKVESGQRIGAAQQPSCVVVVFVVDVLARQEDADIEQPEGQGSGRVDLTSSAT